MTEEVPMKAALLTFIFALLFPVSIQETGLAYRGLASSWNVIPSRSLAGLHYIFKGHEEKEHLGIVKVSGPVIEITNGNHIGAKVHSNGYTLEMDSEDFEDEQELGNSVFEATTRTGTSVGTAFLVGADLVLTNRHVMAYAPDSKERDCGKFSVKLNHREEKVDCAKVRYCSSVHDFCVIELKKMGSGLSVGAEVRPLRLTSRIRSNPDVLLLHIGNAAGMGIQASRGKGVLVKGGEFYHYAPTLGGSSGAPIFDERNEVIGINWGHTGGNYIADSSFNRGVLAKTIFDELIKRGYNRTIKDIKSFRPWHTRQNGHRQVSIKHTQTKPEQNASGR